MSEKLNVFVMWQGPHGAASVEHLRAGFNAQWELRRLSSRRPDNWQVRFRDISEQQGLGENIYARVRSLISECDCAIALHTPDPRPASDGSGNLWIEVALWYALVDPARLLLVSIANPFDDAGLLPSVTLPSDLLGELVPQTSSFIPENGKTGTTFLDLEEQIRNFLEAQCRLRDDTRSSAPPLLPYPVKDKVRDVFGVPIFEWLEPRIAECTANHGDRCHCAEQALAFGAELVRMESSSWELARLASLLHQLALKATEVKSASWKSLRVDKMTQLREVLRALTAFEEQVLCRAKEKKDKPATPWVRLADFLTRRIALFPSRVDPGHIATAVTRFRDLATELMANEIFKHPFFGQSDLSKEQLPETLDLLSVDAERLAEYVADLHNAWFEKTQSFLDQKVRTAPVASLTSRKFVDDPVSRELIGMALMLGQVSGEMPHNLSGDWKVPIWPQPQSQP